MKSIIKFFIKILLLFVVVFSIYVGSYAKKGYDMYEDALLTESIDEKISTIKEKDNYLGISEIPEIYKEAVVAVEDHRFYIHNGIDYVAIFRAIINNLTRKELAEGGSTITQQLCKNIYFTQDRTLERKFAEIFMAVEMEKICEKDEILELYINTCFYGNNCYTLKEASNLYFKKEPMELTDYEATMIAGIPNAPSLYNPLHSLKLAKERQRQVLYAMTVFGNLSKEDKDEILSHAEEEDKIFIKD